MCNSLQQSCLKLRCLLASLAHIWWITLGTAHSGWNTRRALREVFTPRRIHSTPCAAAPLVAGRLPDNIVQLIFMTYTPISNVTISYFFSSNRNRPVALANITFAKCLPEHICVVVRLTILGVWSYSQYQHSNRRQEGIHGKQFRSPWIRGTYIVCMDSLCLSNNDITQLI